MLIDLGKGSIEFKIDGDYKGIAVENNDYLKDPFFEYF